MVKSISRMGVAAALFTAGVVSAAFAPAQAQESIMKTCGAEWQAAKAGGKVVPGTTWPKFLSDCRARHANDAAAPAAKPPAATTATAPAAAPAAKPPAATTATAPAAAPAKPPAAATAAPAAPVTTAAPSTTTPATPAAPTNTATSPAAPATGGREAMLARERQCGARWKEVKGTAALPAGITTWPKYWSWCNTKLKSGQSI